MLNKSCNSYIAENKSTKSPAELTVIGKLHYFPLLLQSIINTKNLNAY